MAKHRVKLTIHPEDHEGLVVHEHELPRLHSERLIRQGEDGKELVTPIEDEAGSGDSGPGAGENADGAQSAATTDGTAGRRAPKTTKE